MMIEEDVARPEPQHLSLWVTPPQRFSAETVINSLAFVPPVRQVTIGADAGWRQLTDQLLTPEFRGRSWTRNPGRARPILERHGAPICGPDLDAALADLKQATDEACEDGFDPPSELALQNADRLLRGMYAHRQCRFEVYPTQDGEVAIYALERKRSVLVLCGSDGSVRCSVNLDGKHCRAYCDPALVAELPGGLPDGFLREVLTALDPAQWPLFT